MIPFHFNESSEATRAFSQRWLILIFSVFLSTGVCVSVMTKKFQRLLRSLRRRLRRTKPPDDIRSEAYERNRELLSIPVSFIYEIGLDSNGKLIFKEYNYNIYYYWLIG